MLRDTKLFYNPDEDEDGIIRWDMNTLTLTSSMKAKVRRFIRDGCVHKIDKNTWEVYPIKGHTHLTHIVVNKNGMLTCTCQRWRTKALTCTHILAVMVYEGKLEI